MNTNEKLLQMIYGSGHRTVGDSVRAITPWVTVAAVTVIVASALQSTELLAIALPVWFLVAAAARTRVAVLAHPTDNANVREIMDVWFSFPVRMSALLMFKYRRAIATVTTTIVAAILMFHGKTPLIETLAISMAIASLVEMVFGHTSMVAWTARRKQTSNAL